MLLFIGLRLAQAKGLFFDRQRVLSAVDRATRRVLARFGAFVRTRARTSIRRRRTVSPPGGPPHSHVGLLRRLIVFAFEPRRQSVVIGPLLSNGRQSERPTVPELLEEGGTVTRRTARRQPQGNGPERLRGSARLRYRARPYMRPAFERERAKLPALWRDSVRP
jgi:hypothetical protein